MLDQKAKQIKQYLDVVDYTQKIDPDLIAYMISEKFAIDEQTADLMVRYHRAFGWLNELKGGDTP